MRPFTFYSPVRLLFGEGRFDELGRHASALGRHALIVTSRQAMRAAGWLDQACELLTDAGLAVTVFDRVTPNPTDGLVNEGGRVAREAGCDVVVGLGGGSSMDAAKAIAVRATHAEPIAEYVCDGPWGARKDPTWATLAVICVTSTSGTSSELTPFAVVTVEELRTKAAIRHEAIYARVALDDPRLTYSVPPRVTAATGLDVFCHSIEAYLSPECHPLGEAVAARAMTIVARRLARVVADGGDTEARAQLMVANVFAGYALSQVGATVVHALEHPVSALHPEVPHGEGLAALLPAYARLMAERVPERLASVAECFGLSASGPTDRVAGTVVGAIEGLLEEVGLRMALRDLQVTAEELPEIAAGAQDYMAGALEKTPGGTDTDFLLRLLQMSL